ncbi:MAG TPA: succinate dehydrogenase, cytochrome b556 subunit [Steroidobacteraceae bacterium]|nr:succinate dehydrogenase, cytochrome b556 subunit [Steroidobacteraceae bacterium]
MAERPLSPHLTVYRFAYTMVLSFLHRITGVALAVGLVVFSGWLMAAASGAGAYARFVAFLGTGLLRLLLGAWLLALVYHFANGIRHLCWDAGLGLEKSQARRSAWIVVVLGAIVALALLYAFFVAAPVSP